MSSSPQTQAVGTPSGAYFAWGTSFRRGNFVESGSNGMAVAVLFMVRKSLICVNLLWAVILPVIVQWCESRRKAQGDDMNGN